MEINMKIAICDDCLTQLNELKDIISDINIVSSFDLESFTSPSFLLERCSLIGFDIVFLDVDMPEMNGIELGKALHRISPRTILIFVTSYPEYAVEGYQCEALRYILKPYTKDEIFSALKRAIEIIGNQKHCVTVKNHNKPISISVEDIYYLEYCHRHILYHTKNRVIETTGVFSNAYKELIPYGFYQVHQGYIVNMSKIYDFKDYDIILDNGMKVPVSVRKKSEVMISYAKFLERQ
jgi:DNA-binding LytR/AlgR family response regulator